ncbi:hypothetical protein MB46_19345 (plasmid) [Arthrobacter alpinus]|uniref:hypothetical protein n=1 Tax=Arthrobacter alpinus TaxID=656366 RepID=UPI000678F023|nr:hypothetical protein [Arthrobacter alpinus]ALV47833.1 hypothetical protein MB46_19345 [Arthrobacter alpinus]
MTVKGKHEFTRRGFLTASSVAALSAAGLAAGAAPAHAQDTFEVSTGWADITPPVGHPMGGYGDLHISEGVNEPLAARCTIIWDAGSPNVIVTADVLGFGRGLHQSIRAEVVALGVPTADFVLTATHTHKGPALLEVLDPYMAYGITDLSELHSYTNDLAATIVNLVDETLNADRTYCTLDYHVLSADFSFNRTNLSYVERDVPVLVARDLDGDPRAVLFSYGTHPVASGDDHNLFDPDYPSEAIKTIEAIGPEVHAQFILGPAGDQNPTDQGDVTISDAFGTALGSTIANAIGTPGRAIEGPIKSTLLERSLPLDVTNTPQNLANVRAAYATRLNDPTGWVRRHAQRMIARIDLGYIETTVVLPIQAWTFTGEAGDTDNSALSIVFCGGEVVSGYAAYFRGKYGGTQNLWFTAYANEVPGYIPSDDLLRRPGGGYEAGFDNIHPGIAGGSMCVYGHMGHFRGRPANTTVVGVEQVMIDGITAALA